jgi:peptidyl-prolyl cis-trans isomerase A (cyclophilin A)
MRKRFVGVLFLAVSFAAAQTLPKTAPKAAPQAVPKKSGTTAPKTGVTRPSLYNPSSLKDKAPEQFMARFTTAKGDIVFEVTRALSPLGADRFYNLVKYGYYNGDSLFRVVSGFVVQFGISPTPAVNAAWEKATIADEPPQLGNTNGIGMLTFAKTGAPNSRTTQVFINLKDNSFLDPMGFTPFGKVVEGMDVVEKLYSGYGDQPTGMQEQISKQGTAFLKAKFPELDSIVKASIVPPIPAPAATPAPAPVPKK